MHPMYWMHLLAYAPLGAFAWMQLGLPGDQSTQLLYGLAAGVAGGYVLMRQGMSLSAMWLYPLSGAAFGYLFMGQFVGGQMFGALLGAVLGYAVLRMKVSSGSSRDQDPVAASQYVAGIGL